MANGLGKIPWLSPFLDVVFPPKCGFCRQTLEPQERNPDICAGCRNEMTGPEEPFCLICGQPFGSKIGPNRTCGFCLAGHPTYDAARYGAAYQSPAGEAVKALKYGPRPELARTLGQALAWYLKQRRPFDSLNLKSGEMVIPVPLHLAKLRKRSFNQTLLIARELCRSLGSAPPDYECLVRSKKTKSMSQTGLSRNQRMANVRGAFEVVHRERIKGRTVLLVDDVMTTGATVSECAKALKRGGADRVLVLTVCRTLN